MCKEAGVTLLSWCRTRCYHSGKVFPVKRRAGDMVGPATEGDPRKARKLSYGQEDLHRLSPGRWMHDRRRGGLFSRSSLDGFLPLQHNDSLADGRCHADGRMGAVH